MVIILVEVGAVVPAFVVVVVLHDSSDITCRFTSSAFACVLCSSYLLAIVSFIFSLFLQLTAISVPSK